MTIRIDVDKERIVEFCRRWKITEFAFFGSAMREDSRPDSDADVLVTFEPEAHWTLFDLAHMDDELKEIMGREVDLVTRAAVEQSKNYIRRKHILNNMEPFYVAR